MSLELKKKQLELRRVESARMELELKIEEKLDEIERLKKHIETQIEAEEKLKLELENIK